LAYCTKFSSEDKVLVMLKENRGISRLKNSGTMFSDAPDDGQTDRKIARQLAAHYPVLLLTKQNGEESKGWRGHAFYWPVLTTPANTLTSIYTEE